MNYIATFFSHFGAIKFKKSCEALGYPAKTMPVPRKLSSSCGICTAFEAPGLEELKPFPAELEKVVLLTQGGYELLFAAEE